MSYIAQLEDGSNAWYIYYNTGVGLKFILVDGGVNAIVTGTAGEILDTNWHHIALCKVADEYAIYLDGTQVNYTQDSSTRTFNAELAIGTVNLPATYYVDGLMDEIRIQHSNAFSAAPSAGITDTITVPTAAHTEDADTVLLLHLDGDFEDSSGRDHEVTAVLVPITVGPKFGTASAHFNGTDQYLTIQDSTDWDIFADLTSDWTVDFWVKHEDHDGAEYYMVQYANPPNMHWQVSHNDGEGVRFAWRETAGDYDFNLIGPEITDTNWHHIAFFKHNAEVALYFDGDQVDYGTQTEVGTIAEVLAIGAWRYGITSGSKSFLIRIEGSGFCNSVNSS